MPLTESGRAGQVFVLLPLLPDQLRFGAGWLACGFLVNRRITCGNAPLTWFSE